MKPVSFACLFPALALLFGGAGGPVRAQTPPPLPPNSVWLDALDLTPLDQGYGTPQANLSVDKHPLTLGGMVYPHGVGSHARATLVLNLHGDATRFVSTVGVDDETKGGGSVTFEVLVDGRVQAATPVLHGGDVPKLLSVDLTGAKQLVLRVGDGGDNLDLDHADWGGAYLTLKPGTTLPQTVSTDKEIMPPNTIRPGAVWRDTAGDVIQAHGAGMIKVGSTYYWFGEDKTNGYAFQNINCYASTDLIHWTFKGHVLSRQPAGDLGPGSVVERPKVIYNSRTKMYVMYMHLDSSNYGKAQVGVAVSPRVDGPYTYKGGYSPSGHQSRDMTLFQDTDGAGYLVYEDRASGVRIARLSDDYLTLAQEVALIPESYEAPALVKIKGVYYLLGSRLSGWDANANKYTTATSLAGPWAAFQEVAPPATRTYTSQTAYILPIFGTAQTTYLYLGDRWKPNNLTDSRYLWLPLTVDAAKRTLFLPYDDPWTLSVKTGVTARVP